MAASSSNSRQSLDDPSQSTQSQSSSIRAPGPSRRSLSTSIRERLHIRSRSNNAPVNLEGLTSSPQVISPTQASFPASGHEGDDAASPAAMVPPSCPLPQHNPIEPYLGVIVAYAVATGAVSLLSSHLHWSLGWLALLFGIFALRKTLLSRDADAAYQAKTARELQRWKERDQTETVEWINSLLSVVWPLISADIFLPFVDLLEDALQLQVPGIVHAVRVEDLDQGVVPLRIHDFKVLPNDEDSFLGAEYIGARKQAEKAEAELEDAEGNTTTAVDMGEHVNLEVSFSYRAPPHAVKSSVTRSANAREHGMDDDGGDEQAAQAPPAETGSAKDQPTETIHLLLYLAIGLQKIAAVEVPVWVEMVGIQGKMRLRLQLVPSAPFVKNVGFTLLEQPKLEIKAKPLGRRMVIDAMNLPLLSSYVLRSIQTTVAPFVSPGSYTIDVAGLLGTGSGPRNTYAVGVIGVVLHSASDLPAADSNGFSDPFISLSFARAGKPLFRTRVLRKTRHPTWQEVAFVLVSPDEIRDHERLRFTVFDADRFSADDPLGKVEISIDRLISKSLSRGIDVQSCTLFETRTDPLLPMRRGGRTSGHLKYSIVFARLVQPHSAGLLGATPTRAKLMEEAARRGRARPPSAAGAEQTPVSAQSAEAIEETAASETPTGGQGKDEEGLDAHQNTFDRFVTKLGIPLDKDLLLARKARHDRVKKLVQQLGGEEQATFNPPDPTWPTGILAFHIDSIQGLEVTRTQRSYRSANLSGGVKQGLPTDDTSNEASSSRMPSSYVQVLLNDEPVLRTRTKTFNPRPYINAGSERLVSDWRHARIEFVVRDSRQRENDPILGIVALKVSDLLSKSARRSDWYTLTGGLGYGKMQVTLLWRSVHLQVPSSLCGWNLGVLEISKLSAQVETQVYEGKDAHFILQVPGGSMETPSIAALTASGEDGDDDDEEEEPSSLYLCNMAKQPGGSLRIPVRQRYPGQLVITLKSSPRIAPGRHRTRAILCVPLSRLVDNRETTFRAPLWVSHDWYQIEQATLKATSSEGQSPPGDDDTQAASPGAVPRPLPRHIGPALEELHRTTAVELPEELCVELAPSSGEKELSSRLEDVVSSASQASIKSRRRSRSLSGSRSGSGSGSTRLRRAGYVDLTCHFFNGLAEEHRSILAGDHELRFAHEAWQALVDCGERPLPRRAASEGGSTRGKAKAGAGASSAQQRQRGHNRAVSAASALLTPARDGDGDGEGSGAARSASAELPRRADDDADDDDGAGDWDAQGVYEPSITASSDGMRGANGRQRGSEEGLVYSFPRDEDGDEDDEGEAALYGDFDRQDRESRRARRRSLHRQERGAAQLKGFRTISWLKQNVEDGVGRVKRNVQAVGGETKRLAKMEKEGVSSF